MGNSTSDLQVSFASMVMIHKVAKYNKGKRYKLPLILVLTEIKESSEL